MADNYLLILADIVARLQAVEGMGVVHDYERQSKSHAEFIKLFQDDAGKINGWEITRRSAREHQRGAFFRHHLFYLKGYRGLQDAEGSSKDFQVLADRICEAFRTADAPEGASWYYRNGDEATQSPAQVEIINDRMFGNVLCHCAEIALSVTEKIIQ